jgi:hypothetical protein
LSPDEFARFIGAQTQKWTATAKAANVKVD